MSAECIRVGDPVTIYWNDETRTTGVFAGRDALLGDWIIRLPDGRYCLSRSFRCIEYPPRRSDSRVEDRGNDREGDRPNDRH